MAAGKTIMIKVNLPSNSITDPHPLKTKRLSMSIGVFDFMYLSKNNARAFLNLGVARN